MSSKNGLDINLSIPAIMSITINQLCMCQCSFSLDAHFDGLDYAYAVYVTSENQALGGTIKLIKFACEM